MAQNHGGASHHSYFTAARVAQPTGRPMIQRLVHLTLHQRFITVTLVLLLTPGGIVAFHGLPI